MAPAGGLIVAVDRVCFENVDFVWKHPAAAAAMIGASRAGHGEFRGCTFQAATRRGGAGGHRLDPSGR